MNADTNRTYTMEDWKDFIVTEEKNRTGRRPSNFFVLTKATQIRRVQRQIPRDAFRATALALRSSASMPQAAPISAPVPSQRRKGRKRGVEEGERREASLSLVNTAMLMSKKNPYSTDPYCTYRSMMMMACSDFGL